MKYTHKSTGWVLSEDIGMLVCGEDIHAYVVFTSIAVESTRI